MSFIRHNWFSLLVVLITSSLFIVPLPNNQMVYYLLLVILAGLSIIRSQRVYIPAIVLLIACALSIICGNAAPLFRSWERLGLFALLFFAFFPVFQSQYFDRLRSKTFPMMLCVVIFTSIGSFIGYFFGINYMGRNRDTLNSIDTVGWFGGLTSQSMTLSPICAIALTTLVWFLIERAKTKKVKIIVSCAAFASFCCMLLTASRGGNIAGIAGVAVVLFLKYKNSIGKILRVGFIVFSLSVILSPVYMPYAEKVLTKQRKNESQGSTFASRENRWRHRFEEFSEYPVFGYGFAAIDTKNYGEYMPSTGTIEPGSSWLAILSMTGLAGMASFLALLVPAMKKLYRKVNRKSGQYALLHLGIIAVFMVHFFVEGYVFAAGGGLCVLFWFFFGCACSYVRNPMPYFLLDES